MELENILKSKIGVKLVRVGKLSRTFAMQKFSEANHEITPEQFTILAVLSENDGMYQRQIANITLKDRPNITRLLKILEKMELITKKADVNKRKIYKIFLTDKGRQYYENILPTVLDIWKTSVTGVSEEELEICSRALNIFRRNLEQEVKIQPGERYSYKLQYF